MAGSRPRVLVTRAVQQASALADALQQCGFDVLSIPALQIVEPTDRYAALDAVLHKLAEHQWLIFTSANAVEAVSARMKHLGLTMPASLRIASIGAATTRVIEAAGWKVALQPETAIADALAEALLPYAAESKMFFPRAEQGRDTLPLILRRAGAQLTLVPAYRTILPEASVALIQKDSDTIDAVCFTSSSSVLNLAAMLDKAGVCLREDAVLASIGPVTTGTMLQLGLRPQIETSEASVAALVNALARYFKLQ
ncbi:MAG: uroporphyrinogen-III synthase [Acidobacteria bacterium]|nr:uroporphyrinogen-III synthase [Acidobacteriota bacterium]